MLEDKINLFTKVSMPFMIPDLVVGADQQIAEPRQHYLVTRKEAIEAVDDIRRVIKLFSETLSDAGKVDWDWRKMLEYADLDVDRLEKVSLLLSYAQLRVRTAADQIGCEKAVIY